jgi:endonuclease G, mitochondrial
MTMLEEATTTQQKAAERVRRRTGQRHQKIEAISTGQLMLADEPIRIASRIERLSRYYPAVRPVSPAALVANDPEVVQAAGAVLERIINTPDFVDVRYLNASCEWLRVLVETGHGQVS